MSELVDNCVDLLVKDPEFNKNLDSYISTIMKDGKIDFSDVPELVQLITECYNNFSQFKLSYNELPEFIQKVTKYILDNKNVLPQDKKEEFEKMINVAIKLVMTQPKVKSCIKKTFSCLPCFQ